MFGCSPRSLDNMLSNESLTHPHPAYVSRSWLFTGSIVACVQHSISQKQQAKNTD